MICYPNLTTWIFVREGFFFKITKSEKGFDLSSSRPPYSIGTYATPEEAATAVRKRRTGVQLWDYGGVPRIPVRLDGWIRITSA